MFPFWTYNSSGELMEQVPFDDFIDDLKDVRHLWAYAIDIKSFLPGYKGPEVWNGVLGLDD